MEGDSALIVKFDKYAYTKNTEENEENIANMYAMENNIHDRSFVIMLSRYLQEKRFKQKSLTQQPN